MLIRLRFLSINSLSSSFLPPFLSFSKLPHFMLFVISTSLPSSFCSKAISSSYQGTFLDEEVCGDHSLEIPLVHRRGSSSKVRLAIKAQCFNARPSLRLNLPHWQRSCFTPTDEKVFRHNYDIPSLIQLHFPNKSTEMIGVSETSVSMRGWSRLDFVSCFLPSPWSYYPTLVLCHVNWCPMGGGTFLPLICYGLLSSWDKRCLSHNFSTFIVPTSTITPSWWPSWFEGRTNSSNWASPIPTTTTSKSSSSISRVLGRRLPLRLLHRGMNSSRMGNFSTRLWVSSFFSFSLSPSFYFFFTWVFSSYLTLGEEFPKPTLK